MRQKWLPYLILLWAAGMRFIGLYHQSPPGLSHDEVANWLIDRSILAGEHALYFTEAYGHEAGFHYWQTALVWLLGDHALALRLAAAFLGVGVVAITFSLIRRVFGRNMALIAMAVAAGHFWPVFYSRQALRAIMLPFTAALSLYFLWVYLFPKPTSDPAPPSGLSSPVSSLSSLVSRPSSSVILAAFFAGLSSYSYMASRALPFLFGGWIVYLLLFHAQTINIKEKWRGLTVFFMMYALLSWPLVAFIQAAPEAEIRIAEVDGPLRALLAGEFGPVVENGVAILGMFGFAGDPLWRQNVAGTAVFGWPAAVFFYAGVGIALWRWRDPRYGLLLIWAAAAALPSLVTIDAPSTIRMILFLPLLGVFPAIVIHSLSTLSPVFPQLSTVFTRNLGIYLLTFAILLFSSARTVQQLGVVWPQNDEVQFVWQRDLTTAAFYLNDQPAVTAATIVGWTPETMDEPTMQVTLRRHDVALRFTGRVGAVTTAVLPGDKPANSVLLRPKILPFEAALEETLTRHGVHAQIDDNLAIYRWSEPFQPQPQTAQTAAFAGELLFWGFDQVGECLSTAAVSCQIITYWQVTGETNDERRFFLHMVDDRGEVIAQSDLLDAPARFWQEGDWLIQVHTLPTAAELFSLQLGVYDPRPPFARLLTAAGEDHIQLSLGERTSDTFMTTSSSITLSPKLEKKVSDP
ncbi:MAG: hypothetical protein QNJ45_20800 [Ardenticatenaceae bacterium]|nr:hypothetical protein [Ardenticatenaceae bacterium]